MRPYYLSVSAEYLQARLPIDVGAVCLAANGRNKCICSTR